MQPNQQYLDWLKGESNGYDWVDVTNFLFIAQAEITDYSLTSNEIAKIQSVSEIIFSSWIGEGVPYTDTDLKKKLKVAFDWYQSIQDNSAESEIDSNIMNQIQKNASWLKSQEWFSETYANSVLGWLLEISEVDGINENEKGSIRALSAFWGVQSPI
jgi:hypothetical protein